MTTEKHRQPIEYARTTLSKNKSYQMIRLSLTILDNGATHFWLTLTDALSAWDVAFAQQARQKSFPVEEKSRAQFFSQLTKQAKSSPLILEIVNSQKIYDRQVTDFLDALVNIRITGLFVLVLSDSEEAEQAVTQALEENKNRYFSPEEERAYYAQMAIPLDDRALFKIRDFTGGWANAVVTLAWYLSNEAERQAIVDDLEGYVNRWIEREMNELFLEGEHPVPIALSLLDEFPMALLQGLTKMEGQVLQQALGKSPFVRRNPDTGWFYYGKRTRQYLRLRLLELDKRQQQQSFVQIGDWFHKQGYRIQAIFCYRLGGANSKILAVLNQWISPFSRELANCYYEAITAMPRAFVEKHPLLYVMQGHTLCTMFRYDEADRLMEACCLRWDKGDDTPEELRSILGEAYATWMRIANVKLDLPGIIARMRRAAELLPNGSSLMRGKLNRRADAPMLSLPSPDAGALTESLEVACRLDPYYTQIIQGGGVGISNLAKAEFHFYTHNLKEAERYAVAATVDRLESEQYDLACSAYFLLMRLNMAKGNYDRLMESMELLEHCTKQANYDTFFSMPDLAHSWLALRLGKKLEVANWILDEKIYRETVKPWNTGRDLVIRAYYYLEMEAYAEAAALAERTSAMYQQHGQMFLTIYLWLIQAVSHNCLGEFDRAVILMERVYQWVHGNNIVMPVIECGRHILPVIKTVRAHGGDSIPEPWLQEMEKKARSYQACQNKVRSRYRQLRVIKTSIVEILTVSELKLLHMVTNGMTLQEIAEAQGRSRNTVKTMLRTVYSKIGATNLSDAIRIAIECNIDRHVKL